MMRMMRSINVPAAVVGYSAVVSCRLNIRRWMIEDNKQFSDYHHPDLDAEAAGLMKSEREGKNSKQFSDNYHAKIDTEDRKQYSYQPDLAAGLAFASRSFADLEVFQKLYHKNPMDVQILKKLAATMSDLATITFLPLEYTQRVEWLRESKSLLEKALDINKNDDNIKFELGRAHYYILRLDPSVKWGSHSYVEHVLSAYRYFKEVEDKGPEVYKYPMLDALRQYVWPFMSDLESISHSWKSSSSKQNKKQERIRRSK